MNGAMQRGFSIVEILISLVIGSMVILTVMTVYNTSRDTYSLQVEVGHLGENVRIGNGLLERTIRQGNHRRIPMLRDTNPLLVTAFGFTPLQGIEGSGTAPGTSDTVEITYNGSTDPATGTADGRIVNCLGLPVASDQLSSNRFRIRVDAAGRPWIACSTDSGTSWTDLIPDVEALKVEYGIYSNESRSVSTYVPWSLVTDPMRVVAIKLFLLYRSSAEIADRPSPATYQLSTITYGPFDDRYLRSLSELTVVIRSSAL